MKWTWLSCLSFLLFLGACSDRPWHWPWENAPARLELPGVAYSGDQAMLLLSPAGQPLVNPSLIQIQRAFFDCKGFVGDWYQQLMLVTFCRISSSSFITDTV